MALTDLQRRICRALAERRVADGESDVAGGAALGEATGSARLLRDVDVFHDAIDAVAASWEADRQALASDGLAVHVLRERPAFVEASVSGEGESTLVQWAADSAYRFFPLVEHAELGLTLHPFDLATNKVLALVGRLEARDWIDVLAARDAIQPLGLLAWAACGKDPGFSPAMILEQAARSARYSQPEIDALEFTGETPSAAALSRTWHAALDGARQVVAALPAEQAGTCVLDDSGALAGGSPEELAAAAAEGRLAYHEGSVRGAFPTVGGR